MDVERIYQGLEVMAYGLAGVFSVLILFYLVTKLMVYISNKIKKPEPPDQTD